MENVEFVKGYLEDMPLADGTVDAIISNCVTNLSGDKPQVIREVERVLRPGGRFAVSDVIADPDMDEQTRADMAAWTGCVAGALTEAEFRVALHDAGLEDIEVRETHRVHEHAAAAIIRARKPARSSPAPARSTPPGGKPSSSVTASSAATRPGSRPPQTGSRLTSASSRPLACPRGAFETERACCPFLEVDYDADARRLTITAGTAEDRPYLQALHEALGPAASSDEAGAPGPTDTAESASCCAPHALVACCDPAD